MVRKLLRPSRTRRFHKDSLHGRTGLFRVRQVRQLEEAVAAAGFRSDPGQALHRIPCSRATVLGRALRRRPGKSGWQQPQGPPLRLAGTVP